MMRIALTNASIGICVPVTSAEPNWLRTRL